jgi:Carboxypeptidase regulatory-like domain/Oxidoreductase family, C-terminal alpha/beta domain
MRQTIVLAIGLLGAALGIASAQTGGQITGEIRDPSGALIPNASVTVTNTATSVARTTTTNAAGIYSFPDLTPGMYDVKVAVAGFDTIVKTNIPLQVQQTARVDFTLNVGQSTQTVEVAANAAMLTTENATVGTVIEQQRIVDLPLNGRSFFSLVALSPNVAYGFTPAQQASSRLGGSRSTLTISMSGAGRHHHRRPLHIHEREDLGKRMRAEVGHLTAGIVPEPAEVVERAVRRIRFLGRWPEPHVVIQYGRRRNLANMSLRLGRAIRWDPVKEQVIGDKEAAAMCVRPYRAPWDGVLRSIVKV